jgi:peptidoglycan/LPS O-acetylase OafA/YrhL
MDNRDPAARNLQLDGLRGYAAVSVAVFHTILGMDETLIPRIVYGRISDFSDAYSWFAKIILKLFSGETAVLIFFVLSGTVLFQSLMRNTAPFPEVIKSFTVRRIFRIYPALVICLVLMMLLAASSGRPVSLSDFAINASLFSFPMSGVTWTLNVEMVGVAFVLFAFWGWRAGGIAGLLATALFVLLIFRIPSLPIAVTFNSFWIYFILGMLIPTQVGARIGQRLPKWSWPVILVMAVAFKGAVQQGAIALLVTSLYYGRAGAFGQLLLLPISQFLGRISYSFYLYNFVVLVYIFEAAKQFGWLKSYPIEAGLFASLLTVSLTLPLAYVSQRWVEMPGIRLGQVLSTPSR